MYLLQNHLTNNLTSCLFFLCFIYTSFCLFHPLCCVFFNECSLWSFRDGVGTHRVGSAGDGSTAGSGSSSGSSSGPGSEQHLPATCHPDNGCIFQSSSSAGESLQTTHDSPSQHLMASMMTQCATSCFRSALFV